MFETYRLSITIELYDQAIQFVKFTINSNLKRKKNMYGDHLLFCLKENPSFHDYFLRLSLW
jgi:hypothetical protein